MNIDGRDIRLGDAVVNKDGLAMARVILPVDGTLGPVVTLTMDGTAGGGQTRRVSTVLPDGSADTACAAAARKAGLLSTDGRALPGKADAAWKPLSVIRGAATGTPAEEVITGPTPAGGGGPGQPGVGANGPLPKTGTAGWVLPAVAGALVLVLAGAAMVALARRRGVRLRS